MRDDKFNFICVKNLQMKIKITLFYFYNVLLLIQYIHFFEQAIPGESSTEWKFPYFHKKSVWSLDISGDKLIKFLCFDLKMLPLELIPNSHDCVQWFDYSKHITVLLTVKDIKRT